MHCEIGSAQRTLLYVSALGATLRMMYCALWDRRHEVAATKICPRGAKCTDVSEWHLNASNLRMDHYSYVRALWVPRSIFMNLAHMSKPSLCLNLVWYSIPNSYVKNLSGDNKCTFIHRGWITHGAAPAKNHFMTAERKDSGLFTGTICHMGAWHFFENFGIGPVKSLYTSILFVTHC